MKTTTTADFFKEAFNIDWKDMKINEEIDVSKFDKKVQSFNQLTGKDELCLINKIIRKEDADGYTVWQDNGNAFNCASEHKIAYKLNKEMEDFSYQEVKILEKHKEVYGLSDGKWEPIFFKALGRKIPILDFEVEKNHNYFSNNVLSHNTMFGSPETQSGGKAIKFFSSIELDTRKRDMLGKDKENAEGIKTKIVAKKNKTGQPFRKVEIDIDFFNSINVEMEYAVFAQTFKLVEETSKSRFVLPNGDKCHGLKKLSEYFKDNEDVYKDIVAKVDHELADNTRKLESSTIGAVEEVAAKEAEPKVLEESPEVVVKAEKKMKMKVKVERKAEATTVEEAVEIAIVEEEAKADERKEDKPKERVKRKTVPEEK